MADEQRLKDATITLRLDLDQAQRDLPDGEKKKSPGRKDEDKRREDDAREERRKPRTGRKVATGVAAAAALPRAIVGALKTIVGATVISLLDDLVQGMFDKRIASYGDPSFVTDPGQWVSKKVLEGIEAVFGATVGQLGDLAKSIETGLPIAGAFISSGVAVARSAGAFGLTADKDGLDIMAIAKRQAAVASAQVRMQIEARRLGRAALGGVLIDEADRLRKLLFSTGTSK